jgi:hypothetical protein
MQAELRGCVPKLPYAYSKTLVNRAWNTVRKSQLWSFNLFTSGWVTPPLLTTGTVTATTGLATIQFDATAQAAIIAWQSANPYVLVTQLQFRISVGGIYSLIAYNPGTGAGLLDNIFVDPGGAGQQYQLYQLYYAPPMKDFLGWLSVRNPSFFLNLELDTTRAYIDSIDPQRTWYQFPTRVVPFGIDIRGQGTVNASATLGFPLFELWGQPVNPFGYQCYGMRQGVDLVQPNDTLPVQVGEDLIMAKAREYAYEWAEANKDLTPRNAGPDFRFLIGQCQAIYAKLLIQYRRQDREFIDNYFSQLGSGYSLRAIGIYNTIAGVAAPYTPW